MPANDSNKSKEGLDMKPFAIAKDVFWVGAIHPELRLFDDLFPTKHGTTYNSYLVKGQNKIALIDTVKGIFAPDFMANLKTVCDPAKIDYLIVNHTEPDHSGSFQEFLKINPHVTVVITKPGALFLQELTNSKFNVLEASDELSIDLGGRTLKFVIAPFLHWPDTMFTYLAEDQVLFPCDAFGSHYYSEAGMFNDTAGDFNEDFAFYFDCLVRPFKKKVLLAIAKVKDVPVKVIAPSHGPIHRVDPLQYVKKYQEFSTVMKLPNGKKSILVLYLSAHKNTDKLTRQIAAGLKTEKTEVKVIHIPEVSLDQIRDELEKADGLLIGSPTINRDIPKPVWDVLGLFQTVSLELKLAAAYGSFGWSGEAVKMIEDRLKSLKLKTFEPGYKVNFAPTEENLAKAREFGQKFAEAMLV
ncbi:MAG: FprA family A-type flavoprotein [bacterium]|nr:FprA family A-type flavoprotein [bacterium]